MRYTGPKARLCRREGVNLFGSPKYQKIIGRSPNVPGMHGGKRQGKMTEYAKQLREKQKAKRMFGLSEKQFRNYFEKASSSKVVTGERLLELLETRLDNAVYRSGMALTRMQARQFVSHGLFMLNGRRVDVPSMVVKPGDVIEVRASKKGSSVFKHNSEELAQYEVPSWLNVDAKKLSFEVVSQPEQKHFEALINTQPIVEFYSR
ncbi:30S ribosomal protein S4 [bacterium]|nr:30S ribosomal protein S4 [bacterium]NCQ55308.1 30S ribosomal protein S4 [Candidatus Parcubacteria bacterium]NCS67179.1 30S ribosomal protein S4 [Candidatus Peregrinibacteria bacterium]NCS96805.1 30S ribosomal protein S4 [bacterium]